MKKIRNFNLRLHARELRRRASRQHDLERMGLGEERFSALLAETERQLKPAVIFETFGPESERTSGLAPLRGLAHTLGLATLGPQLAPWLAEQAGHSAERGRVLELVAASAVDQAVQFAVALLKEEVEAERCELSPLQLLEEPEALELALGTLGGDKIELRLSDGRLDPPHSAAFSLSWVARPARGRAPRRAAPRGGATPPRSGPRAG